MYLWISSHLIVTVNLLGSVTFILKIKKQGSEKLHSFPKYVQLTSWVEGWSQVSLTSKSMLWTQISAQQS